MNNSNDPIVKRLVIDLRKLKSENDSLKKQVRNLEKDIEELQRWADKVDAKIL